MAINKVVYNGNTLIDISDTTANANNVLDGEIFYDNGGNRTVGNLTLVEEDPIFSQSVASNITSNDINNWNNKSNFSGNYNDLTNKPTIPTVPTNVSAFTNDAGYLTEHQDISGKQDTLVSGTNIKTINNNSLLGSGDITISGGEPTEVQINGTNITSSGIANILTEGNYENNNKLVTKTYADTKVSKTVNNNTITGIINNSGTINLTSIDTTRGMTVMEIFYNKIYFANELGNGVKVTGILTPTEDNDAVNKKYVDDIVGDIESILGGI